MQSSETYFHLTELGDGFKLQHLAWFSHESLRPSQVAFNPLGDYCLLVTHNLELYAVCVERILPSSTGTDSLAGVTVCNRFDYVRGV